MQGLEQLQIWCSAANCRAKTELKWKKSLIGNPPPPCLQCTFIIFQADTKKKKKNCISSFCSNIWFGLGSAVPVPQSPFLLVVPRKKKTNKPSKWQLQSTDLHYVSRKQMNMPSKNSSPKATVLCVGAIFYSGNPQWTVFGIIHKYWRLQSRQKLKNISLSVTLIKSNLKSTRADSVHPDDFE